MGSSAGIPVHGDCTPETGDQEMSKAAAEVDTVQPITSGLNNPEGEAQAWKGRPGGDHGVLCAGLYPSSNSGLWHTLRPIAQGLGYMPSLRLHAPAMSQDEAAPARVCGEAECGVDDGGVLCLVLQEPAFIR